MNSRRILAPVLLALASAPARAAPAARSTKLTVGGSASATSSGTDLGNGDKQHQVLSLGGHVLFPFERFTFGPSLDLDTGSTDTATENARTGKIVTTSTETQDVSVGGVARYYFGDLDRDAFVPFAYGNFGLSDAWFRTNGRAGRYRGPFMRIGAGGIFLVAQDWAPRFQADYRIFTRQPSGAASEARTTTATDLYLGLDVFL